MRFDAQEVDEDAVLHEAKPFEPSGRYELAITGDAYDWIYTHRDPLECKKVRCFRDQSACVCLQVSD